MMVRNRRKLVSDYQLSRIRDLEDDLPVGSVEVIREALGISELGDITEGRANVYIKRLTTRKRDLKNACRAQMGEQDSLIVQDMLNTLQRIRRKMGIRRSETLL